MEERRASSEGRRNGDAWLNRSLKVFAVVSAVSTVAFYGVPMVGVPARVDALEKSQPAVLMMVCVLYQDTHPQTVPVACDQAIRRGR